QAFKGAGRVQSYSIEATWTFAVFTVLQVGAGVQEAVFTVAAAAVAEGPQMIGHSSWQISGQFDGSQLATLQSTGPWSVTACLTCTACGESPIDAVCALVEEQTLAQAATCSGLHAFAVDWAMTLCPQKKAHPKSIERKRIRFMSEKFAFTQIR
ncbi:MAG: hypothetical protein R3330_09445, partial [Saprospiraceae bacterium]|nr:hypothetical protein [Saprospiraceae bacterium]